MYLTLVSPPNTGSYRPAPDAYSYYCPWLCRYIALSCERIPQFLYQQTLGTNSSTKAMAALSDTDRHSVISLLSPAK